MKDKHSLVFKLVLVAAVFLAVTIINFSITGFATYDPDTSACWYNSSHPAYPDWNITESSNCTVTDEVIELLGDLTVYGNLTLDNVTLILNSTADGDGTIWAYSGSIFNITSGSNITSNDTDYEFGFEIDYGSTFEMRDSYLSEFGYNSTYQGLTVRANNVLIQNNTIHNGSFHGIYLHNSNDSTISGNILYGFVQTAIFLWLSPTNTTITNNIVYESKRGLSIGSASSNNVTNNTFYDNTMYGISITITSTPSDYNVIHNNTVYNNGYDSIFIVGGDHSVISNNTVHDSGLRGIYLFSSSGSENITIANNTVYDNNYGIHIQSEDHTVNNNLVYGNNQRGIFIESATNITLTENNMTDNKYNFYLSGSSDAHFNHSIDSTNIVGGKPIIYNVSVSDYVVPSNAGFVGCMFCDNITIGDVILRNNGYGILFRKTNNSLIQNITSFYNYNGIYASYSSNNTVTGSTIYNNDNAGFHFESSNYNNTFSNNIVYSHSLYGIYLSSSSNDNNLINNTVYDNARGIYFSTASNNTVINNTVQNNTQGLYLSSSNTNNITNNSVCFNSQALFNNTATNTIDNNTFCNNLLAPSHGSSVSSLTNFTFNVSNPLFTTSCQLYFDGTYAATNSSVYNHQTSTIPYTDFIVAGSHSWFVYCNDSLSTNWANSSLFTFTKQAVCGDSQCETGESCSSCSADCGICPTIGGGGGIITIEPELEVDPTEQPLEIIPIPEPGTVIDIPLGGVSIELEPNVFLNLYGDEATIHNITKVEGGTYKIILCDQAELVSYEINVTADLAYFCMNYSDYTNITNISIYKFDVGWEELSVGDITIDTKKHMVCGKIESTPYMIAGFSRPATAKLALDVIDLAGQAITSAELDGLNTEEAKRLLDEAIRLYYNCNYDDAEELANRAIEIILSLRQPDLFWILVFILVIMATVWYFYGRLKRKTRLRELQTSIPKKIISKKTRRKKK